MGAAFLIPSETQMWEVRVKRNGRWCSLKRAGEGSTTEADAASFVVTLRLNKDARTPIPREEKQELEREHHRNESLRKLNGVPDGYEPKPSKQLERHRKLAAALNDNKPLRPRNGPVIHSWGRK